VTATSPSPVAEKLDIRPLSAVIGAEVDGVDLSQPLEPETVAQIRQALLRWRVVFFRDQPITGEQQIAFGRAFGELDPGHPVGGEGEEYPELLTLDASRRGRRATELRGVNSSDPAYARAENHDPAYGWHTDLTFVANPAWGTILRAEVVPDHAGDTQWTNLVAAYEGLSAPIQAAVDRLHAVHQWHSGRFGIVAEENPVAEPVLSAVHPVVRVHPETGEKAVFVNPHFTRYIVGLSKRESDAILRILYEQLSRYEYTVRFRWRPGSIAFWDNRATAHLAAVDILHAGEVERRLQRVTLSGDLTVGPDGFRSQPLVGGLFGRK